MALCSPLKTGERQGAKTNMIEPKTVNLISLASLSIATSWLLTSTGAFIDGQTITLGGVVFTTKTTLSSSPAVAGEVLIGANAAATIINLAAALNAPLTTTSTFTALSVADANTVSNIYGLSAIATSATVLTVSSSKIPEVSGLSLIVSETQTNAAWTAVYLSPGFVGLSGGKASLQFVAASITSGNGVFTLEVSNDATNWTAYNRLTTNATNTNAQTDTRVASVTLSANGTSVVTIPDSFAFYRVTVTMTTDGSYSATAFII